MSHADSFAIKSAPDSTMIASGLISSIICITELSKVACTQLKKGFTGLFSLDLYLINFVIFSDHYAM